MSKEYSRWFNCSNFTKLVLTIILIQYCYSAPLPENIYTQFIKELTDNECSIPTQVRLPFNTTNSENFEYLSSYLKICQNTESTKSSKEADILCKEIFARLRNISCPTKPTVLPDIDVDLPEKVCTDLTAMHSFIPADKSFLWRVTDNLLCDILCEDEFEKACQVLLWSYKVQTLIASVENEKESAQLSNDLNKEVNSKENIDSVNLPEVHNPEPESPSDNVNEIPEHSKDVGVPKLEKVEEKIEQLTNQKSNSNANEEQKQINPENQTAVPGPQEPHEAENKDTNGLSRATTDTKSLSADSHKKPSPEITAKSKAEVVTKAGTFSPSFPGSEHNDGNNEEHGADNEIPDSKNEAEKENLKNIDIPNKEPPLKPEKAGNPGDASADLKKNEKEISRIGETVVDSKPQNIKDKADKNLVETEVATDGHSTNNVKTVEPGKTESAPHNGVAKEETQPQSNTATVPHSDSVQGKVQDQSKTDIVAHDSSTNEEGRETLVDQKKPMIPDHIEESVNAVPESEKASASSNQKTSVKDSAKIAIPEVSSVVPSSPSPAPTETAVPLENMENDGDIPRPADREPDQYNDMENNEGEDEDYSKPDYDGVYEPSKNKELNPDVPSVVSVPKEVITDQNEKPFEFPSRDTFGQRTNDIQMIAAFPEQEDSHFFFYFLSIVLILMAGYLIFHNKQKIIALIVEGRHERRRRSHGVGYKKLETK